MLGSTTENDKRATSWCTRRQARTKSHICNRKGYQYKTDYRDTIQVQMMFGKTKLLIQLPQLQCILLSETRPSATPAQVINCRRSLGLKRRPFRTKTAAMPLLDYANRPMPHILAMFSIRDSPCVLPTNRQYIYCANAT